MEGPRDFEVVWGTEVVLECEVVGIPFPSRSWTKNGKVVSNQCCHVDVLFYPLAVSSLLVLVPDTACGLKLCCLLIKPLTSCNKLPFSVFGLYAVQVFFVALILSAHFTDLTLTV